MDGRAFISVNKALVTQASSAIPVVPLYISILYKIMKEHGTHEGCIEQIDRLFRTRLFEVPMPQVDAEGRIRIDDLEMKPEVQQGGGRDLAEGEYGKSRANSPISPVTGASFSGCSDSALPGIDYDQKVEADIRLKSE